MHLDKCCFYLHLKTGCYIISAIYLIYGCLTFIEEILNAIFRFAFIKKDILSVAYAYDLTPSVIVVFSSFLLYGTYKGNPLFVFTGVPLSIMQLFLNCFSLSHALVISILNKFAKYPPNTPQLFDQALGSVFLLYFILIINGHRKELKREPSVELTTNRGFMRIDNQTEN